MCFWLPLGLTDRNTCMVIVTNFLIKKKKKVITDLYRIFEILSVLDHFDDELGGEDNKIESHSRGGPFEDMKRSYAPENISPGSLIPCVAPLILVKIKITAKLGLGNPKFIM
jgi:hypothetical protein